MKNASVFLIVFFVTSVAIAQYTAIPDTNFEQALIDQGIDTEGILDGQVLTNDINTVTSLDVSYSYDIFDLTGIEDFAALNNLNFAYNYISEIDLMSNNNLKILKCQHNELASINLSGNPLLEELYCGNPAIDVGPFNQIPSLDLSNNMNLKALDCINLWGLSDLDLSLNLNLEILDCGFNNLTNLDLSNNTFLETIRVNFCELTGLDLSNNTALKYLTVSQIFPFFNSPNSNQIQSLDLSNNIALESLWVEDSIIEELSLKNGSNNILLFVQARDNPNLVCITVDDEEAANAGDFPYSGWDVDSGLFYSENCVLGVASLDNSQLDLFPNPATDFLYVENSSETITKIEVLDLLGKIVKTKTKDFNQIDFTHFKSGVYFVKFYIEKYILTKKVIKK